MESAKITVEATVLFEGDKCSPYCRYFCLEDLYCTLFDNSGSRKRMYRNHQCIELSKKQKDN
jgi:hypothetical protein